MARPAITVEDLSKAYRIGAKEEIPDTLATAAASWAKAPLKNLRKLTRLNTFDSSEKENDLHWALKQVSFQVNEGDVLGIIGHNGAGKSTLLKILSRITRPTSGRVVIRGRVSSLLEVGTGFHPELSGRENIYMNGTILGMRKCEIDRGFDDIVDFSGISRFLDTPIKRYSSGMKVRLAFAVAAHLRPEILVIDEVLAVGDQEFQNKCLGKMHDVAGEGRTVLFVSHNMAAVKALCGRALRISDGMIVDNDVAQDVVSRYLTEHAQSLLEVGAQLNGQSSSGLLKTVRILGDDRQRLASLATGDTVYFEFELSCRERISDAAVIVKLLDDDGRQVTMLNSRRQCNTRFDLVDRTVVGCEWRRVPLPAGRYSIRIQIASRGVGIIDELAGNHFLQVQPSDVFLTGRFPTQDEGVFVADVAWMSPTHTSQRAFVSEAAT